LVHGLPCLACRAEAGVPQAVQFATKGRLAQTILARAFATGVPAALVTGDEVYLHAVKSDI
jgi:hypothetical protein